MKKGDSPAKEVHVEVTKPVLSQDPMKFKSRELMERTGNKFNDLYALRHKIDFIKPRRDKTALEIEFE